MAQSSEAKGTDAPGLIAEGRAALLAGDKARAQALLEAVVRDDPENVEAWLWLSGAHTDPDEISYCLFHVLLIDPDNEQAHEGLAWVKETYGSVAPPLTAPDVAPEPQVDPQPSPPLQPESPPRLEESPAALVTPSRAYHPVDAATPQDTPVSTRRLFEAGLQVGAVGALLGLLRLVGMLRPGTLLLIRGQAGAIDAPSALLLAAGAALVHALALVVAWLVLSRSLARARRHDSRGDRAASLLRVAQALTPGYLAGLALLVAGVGLNWSERRWLPVVALVWGLLLIGGVWIGRRLVGLLHDAPISRERRALRLAWIVLPALLVALVGLGLAGLAVQALLRSL